MTPKKKTKTETIKERAIYVYLPSHKSVQDWKVRAKEQGLSISKFVIEHVENSLRQEMNSSYESRGELIRRIEELKGENSKLLKENKMVRLAFERVDKELKHYRARPFLEEPFEGVRGYEKELIELLKRKRFIVNEELLELLGIDPKDTSLVKAINKQLESLEAYGLVNSELRGWRWKA